MLVERGKVKTLRELGEKFLRFAQKGNSTTQAWELIDDRLHSFYGATLKVSLEPKYKYLNDKKYSNFYISFQHVDVTKNTYASWLRNSGHYLCGTYNRNTVYVVDKVSHKIISRTKYGTDNRENMFSDTGEFIAIGCHTSFDKDLWMAEQGGITCSDVADGEVNKQNLMPVRKVMDGRTTLYKGITAFPGTGCPWLTISDNNKTTYRVSDFIDDVTDENYLVGYGIIYWFTKTNFSATITFKLANDVDPDLYQSISFGMMDGIDAKSYPFPLFVAGGNQALRNDIEVYSNPGQVGVSPNSGNSYYLDMYNPCLSNSNLLHPTKFNGSNTSNFRVMAPDGVWRDVFYHTEIAKVVPYFTCSGPPPNYAYPLVRVNIDGSLVDGSYVGSNDSIASLDLDTVGYLLCSDIRYTTDNYLINSRELPSELSVDLDEVMVAMNYHKGNNLNGFLGVIPNAYRSWSRSLKSGEIVVNNKHYLVIPNGWDGRLYLYKATAGVVVNDEWTYDKIIKNANQGTNENLISDKLIIPLED